MTDCLQLAGLAILRRPLRGLNLSRVLLGRLCEFSWEMGGWALAAANGCETVCGEFENRGLRLGVCWFVGEIGIGFLLRWW